MLSYGSPWSHLYVRFYLYARFFPLYVNDETTQAVIDRLGGADALRWHNLHRVTDPHRRRHRGRPGPRGLPDPCDRGHSDYRIEDAYTEAAKKPREALAGSPGGTAPPATPVPAATRT